MWMALAIGISIIIICIFFMVFFHKNIRTLIDRTKEVRYGRAGIQTDNLQQNPPDAKPDIAEELMKAVDSPVLRKEEDFINEFLKKAGVKGGTEKEKLLTRYLASTHLAFVFEQIFSMIWGSQIYILEDLNGRRTGVLKEEIKTLYYDEAVKRWSNFFVNYSYDAYLGFLKDRNLVVEKDGRLFIADYGVEFLGYLAKTGRSGARFRFG